MNKKYISLDLDDSRIKDLADVISNKTSKKILDYLAENEASESEISNELDLPANTVNYNMKKLLKSGLVEKTKNYFWSVKGKKIPHYKVASKSIVISPKSTKGILSILSSIVVTGLIAIGIKFTQTSSDLATKIADESIDKVGSESAGLAGAAHEVANDAVAMTSQLPIPEIAFWFFIGGITCLVIYLIISRMKMFR